jgi:hypothetical protein
MGVPAATTPPSTPAAGDAEIGMLFIIGTPRIGRTEAYTEKRNNTKPVKKLVKQVITRARNRLKIPQNRKRHATQTLQKMKGRKTTPQIP